jgi:hypothetical protein
MKKLITICLLITASYSVKAQTLEQTMDFIGANLKNYAKFEHFTTKCTNNALEIPTQIITSNNSRRNYTKVFMKHIKSVNYSIGASDDRRITIVGQCFLFEFEKLVVDQVEPQSITIYLLASTPIENVKRIIKAIKHAAELEGAKLINDDLFKN